MARFLFVLDALLNLAVDRGERLNLGGEILQLRGVIGTGGDASEALSRSFLGGT